LGRLSSAGYYEDTAGNPIEQGEGCYFPGVAAKTACAYTLPIMLWHDYNPASFRAVEHTAAEFAVPQVCLETTVSCSAPGGTSSSNTTTRAQQPPVFSHAARMAGVGRPTK
jgi:hypothetical protein